MTSPIGSPSPSELVKQGSLVSVDKKSIAQTGTDGRAKLPVKSQRESGLIPATIDLAPVQH